MSCFRYGFGIMAWEVLTQQVPYSDIKKHIRLGARLHRGHRTPIDGLPSDCPEQVKQMIISCWHTDREKRMSALDCYALLNFLSQRLIVTPYDVCLCCDESNKGLVSYIFHRFTQQGLNVYFNRVTEDGTENVQESMSRSKVILACVNQSFQLNKKCMDELYLSKRISMHKVIVPMFTEPEYKSWATPEISFLCQLLSPNASVFDVSSVAADECWSAPECIPTKEVIRDIDAIVTKMVLYVNVVDEAEAEKHFKAVNSKKANRSSKRQTSKKT